MAASAKNYYDFLEPLEKGLFVWFTAAEQVVIRQPPLKVGDLVLLREDNVPAMNWPMGRFTSVCPGKDGKVRVAEIRTSRGNYVRPEVKMSRLPVH